MLLSKERIKSAQKLGRMCLPVFVDTASIHLLNMITSALVSHIGEHAISATSMVGTVQSIAITMFSAITTGAIVKVSQYMGARDSEACERTARQAIMLAVSIALAVSVLLLVFGKYIISFVFGNVGEDYISAAKHYMNISATSLPFYALYSASNGIMYGTGDFKKTLRNSLMINIMHMLISALFIRVLDMGITGAGISLIISRGLCGVFVYWNLRHGTGLIQIRSALVRPEWKTMSAIMRISIPAAIDNLIINGSNLLVQSCVAALGAGAVAANAILNTISGLLLIPGNAINTVSVTVIGQAFGSRDMKRCRRYMGYMLVLGVMLVAVFCALISLVRGRLVWIYASEQSTFELARTILTIMVCAYPLCWPAAFISAAVLRGCGDVKYSTTVSLLTMVLVRVPTAWLFGLHFGWGLAGIWISMLTEWAVRAVFIMPRVFSKKWERPDLI